MSSGKLMALLLWTSLLTYGCASPPALPPTERDAELAAGVRDAIVFVEIDHKVAPSNDEPNALSATDAVRLALTSHPEIQATLARVRVAQAEAHQARLLPNPIISVAFRFAEASAQPVIEASIAAELLSLLQKPAQARAANFRLQAASAEAVLTVIDVIAEVREGYIAIQTLDAMSLALAERKQLATKLRDLAQSRFKAGEGTRLEVTVLDTQAIELEIEIAQHEAELREARLLLARLVGQPGAPARWKLDTWSPSDLPVGDERDWIAAAIKHHPGIQARTWELSALGVERKMSRWEFLEGSEAGVEAERDEGDWSVGPAIAVPLPIFDWGQARRAGANARQIEALHRLTQASNILIEEVRRAHAAYRASQDSFHQVKDKLFPLLERRRTETEAAYLAGEADLVFLLLTERELQDSRAKLIELQSRSAKSFAQLQRAVGGAGVASSIQASSTQPSEK